jgi:hypothetical protein
MKTRRVERCRAARRAIASVLALTIAVGFYAAATPAKASTTKVQYAPRTTGELDCNGYSPVQTSVKHSMLCTDIRGFANVDNANNWNSRFYDNGIYIGHDEPDMTFLSSAAGSGNDVTWTETIGKDPAAPPTTTDPGGDVTHYFELTPAPWFSMAICDGDSYPQLPCTAESDSNAPTSRFPGAGSAFMEMQLYPPGMPPFVDSTSCDDTHWCAALTIDSLECTAEFAQCNNDCEEPVNFAFIQTNGVPAGPPSPQLSDVETETPNAETLLMNPGDKIKVHMYDAPVPGGHGATAFKVVLDDLTTGQSGFMQASAANGFANTSITNCAGTPYNFQPEYSTASATNIVPWAALRTNISTEFETGHFEGCTSLSKPGHLNIGGVIDTFYKKCHGVYEKAGGSEGPETSDALCYPAGDTHNGLAQAPGDLLTGCEDNYYQNGDLDFDGQPYYPDWPTGAKPTSTWAGSFVESPPASGGSQYSRFFFQTDIALSESTCTASGAGCTVPPNGPGHFYPYWSELGTSSTCKIEFGNVNSGTGVNAFGQDGEYGTDQQAALGYPEFIGAVMNNTCPASSAPHSHAT